MSAGLAVGSADAPVGRRSLPVAGLVPIVVALGVLRIPGADWLYAALGLALLVRSRRVPRASTPLAAVYAVCASTSLVATWADPGAQAFTTSYLWPLLAQGLFALGVMSGGEPAVQVRRLVGGLVGGLLLAWTVGLAEIASGIKLIRILSPTSSMAEMAGNSRWVTTSVFTNYNDFCLGLSMLAVIIFAHLLFVRRVHPLLALSRWVVIGSSVALVLVMGSRGALAAGMLSAGVVVLLAVRAVRPRLVAPRRLALAALALSPVVWWLWSSPYVQDHSTATREGILDKSFTLWAADPFTAFVGYGSAGSYATVTETAYPKILMDPHNLLLEVALNFGVLGLAAALWWWLGIVWGTLAGSLSGRAWDQVGVLSLVAALPLTGVVSSRLLPYVYVTVLATGAHLMTMTSGGTDRIGRPGPRR